MNPTGDALSASSGAELEQVARTLEWCLKIIKANEPYLLEYLGPRNLPEIGYTKADRKRAEAVLSALALQQQKEKEILPVGTTRTPQTNVVNEQTGLAPCPFCGGEAEISRKGNARQSSIVVCTDCGGRLESNENDWNTGEFWNRRVSTGSVVSQDTQRLDWVLTWLGDHEYVKDFPTRDWIDNEDARNLIDKAMRVPSLEPVTQKEKERV